MSPATLILDRVTKARRRPRGVAPGFDLAADLTLEGPLVVGILGGNGAGKTTLFNLISGREAPDTGRVLCGGHDIHRVVYEDRVHLVSHQTQRHDNRRFGFAGWSRLAVSMYERLHRRVRVPATKPRIHLWDEPDLHDGYFPLQMHHMRHLKSQGHIVLLCAHPHRPRDLAMLRAVCDRYLFLQRGRIEPLADYEALLAHAPAREYLGDLVERLEAPELA